ncbi:hypothetical protein MTR67_027440 [Solanum verrucosum]|uniref:Polyprotein protein n=1 Tax=Solanum verrucosum TaxID=315347 RepID=A0AAF0R453_SOLVR|nr:hypothetical protein MTR67_027440 [Solanum verrucosum]
MGHLAHLTDVRATRLEAAILAALTPLRAFVDELTTRVTTWGVFLGYDYECQVANLWKDVDYLKSTNFTSLLEVADDVDVPETFVIPPDTTGDVHRGGIATDELEAETDEEQIEVREKNIYEYLPDLEKTIVQSVIQTVTPRATPKTRTRDLGPQNEDSPTDSTELKIGNRSKRDLDAENLNLHHEKM